MAKFLKVWAISTALIVAVLGFGLIYQTYIESLVNSFFDWLLALVLPPVVFGFMICALIGLFLAMLFMAMDSEPFFEYEDDDAA